MKRFNDGMAKGEAALAVFMLLFMIAVAALQAIFRNLTLLGVNWANAALDALDWADFVIQKGTLWLAFLGASLAAHGDRHIGMDIVPRLVPAKVRVFLHGLVGLVGAVICVYLARAFWAAVLINGEERPAEYEILTMQGSVHVCDASAEELATSVLAEPGFYCHVRAALDWLGVQVDTPGAAFQMIVPVMLLFMAVRMVCYGVADFIALSNGEVSSGWRPAEAGDAAPGGDAAAQQGADAGPGTDDKGTEG